MAEGTQQHYGDSDKKSVENSCPFFESKSTLCFWNKGMQEGEDLFNYCQVYIRNLRYQMDF